VSVTAEVGEILKQIAASAQKVTALIGEVSAASSEQAQGIDQVNTAVAQMDKVTQSNAANAEESASASEELSAQAREMSEMVDTLVQIVGGATASRNDKGRANTSAGQARTTTTRTRSAAKAVDRATSGRVHQLLHHDEKKAKTVKHEAPVGARATKAPAEVIPLNDEELKEF
jgi:methyl-accepting chemotaxis protein